MKKKIWLYGITLALGVIMAFLFYYKFEDSLATVIDSKSVTVFQLGVFKNKDDAINYINNHMGYLFFDGTFYRVYGGITVNNIELNQAYLESVNVNYYQKKINVSKEFYNLVTEYDSLTTNIDSVPKTNRDLIESYLESVN